MQTLTVIQVCFVGEGGIDTGGPRREFFRLLVEEGSARYLVGTPGKMTFASNTIACQVHVSLFFVTCVLSLIS